MDQASGTKDDKKRPSVVSIGDASRLLNTYGKSSVAGKVVSQYTDVDGAPVQNGTLAGILTGTADDIGAMGLNELRDECWRQYHVSPFVQSSINDAVGALCGDGFSVSAETDFLRRIIHNHTFDYRNELHKRMTQYVTHRKVSGELYLSLSCHDKGDRFVEVDFLDPARIRGIGKDDCGIVFHPRKTRMPVFYSFVQDDGSKTLIPSIYVAYDPSLVKDVMPQIKNSSMDLRQAKGNKAADGALGGAFERIGGYKRFVIDWESATLARRYGSYLRSVLIWWNLYALLKFTEIDHKRALASFCYVAMPKDIEAWKFWWSLSQEQREASGLMAPKPPGSTLIAPPGWEVKAISPQLPTLTGNDYDLQELLVGGLNLPNDVVTGTSQGRTFGSVKESRGPWGDRIRQDQNNFKLWLTHDFWKPIFYLHSVLYGMRPTFPVRECVGYENRTPVYDFVEKAPWEMLTVSLPVFSAGNLDSTVRAWLGAKSASLDDKLGLSKGTISKKLGIYDYAAERRRAATEAEMFPELKPPTNDESDQEQWIEPGQNKEGGA